MTLDSLFRPTLEASAKRPYPHQYVTVCQLASGEVTLRPIRPEDEPLLIRFHERLSERSVYLRYFQALKLSQRTAHDRLSRICLIDYDRDMVLVAARVSRGKPEIVAVGRLCKEDGTRSAELAALVRDDLQGQGLGGELYRHLIQFARDEGLRRVHSTILRENRRMLRICERLGFRVFEGGTIDATLEAELLLGSDGLRV